MEKKHYYTPTEKREFLKIINKYSPIIGIKANDSNTLRRKNIAWNRIACEYNTSSISPYPASSKQLRRLWFNLKQRNKECLKKSSPESPFSDTELPNDDTLENTDVEEEISTPHFVNVGGSQNLDNSLNTPKTRGNLQEYGTFPETDSEGAPFDEPIDEDTRSKPPSVIEKLEVKRVKNNLLVREYHDRKRRLNELHILQKRLLTEQIREARAKANLAEFELKQQQDLES